MFNTWPLGQVPKELQRPEFDRLSAAGYTWTDPYNIVELFEQKVADFAGAQYGIAVDCCSHGLFLALKYYKATGTITIPRHTYVSVPMQIHHAGCRVDFSDIVWSGVYQLAPYPIYDGATRWCKNMYNGTGLQTVSFQIKKRIPIGRGGMILTNDKTAYNWLKKARHDGRDMKISYLEDDFEMIGWHYYMTPEDAARGILLMDAITGDYTDSGNNNTYVDLKNKKIFTNDN